MPPLSAAVLALLACPVCHQALELGAERETVVRCMHCLRVYPVVDGIPVLISGRSSQILDTV